MEKYPLLESPKEEHSQDCTHSLMKMFEKQLSRSLYPDVMMADNMVASLDDHDPFYTRYVKDCAKAYTDYEHTLTNLSDPEKMKKYTVKGFQNYEDIRIKFSKQGLQTMGQLYNEESFSGIEFPAFDFPSQLIGDNRVSLRTKEICFKAHPSSFCFSNYLIGRTYQQCLKLQNITSVVQHCVLVPPASGFFSVVPVIDSSVIERGLIAPGRSFKYSVLFKAKVYRPYIKDEIVVISQCIEPIRIPLYAHEPDVQANVPDHVDFGPVIIGTMGVAHVLIMSLYGDLNITASFEERETLTPYEDRKDVERSTETPIHGVPFTLTFEKLTVCKDKIEFLPVYFSPSTPCKETRVLELRVDDWLLSRTTLTARGIKPTDIVEISGNWVEPTLQQDRDMFAERSILFRHAEIDRYGEETIKIRNATASCLSYSWRILIPRIEVTDEWYSVEESSVFKVNPDEGTLGPNEEETFVASVKDAFLMHNNCHRVLQFTVKYSALQFENSPKLDQIKRLDTIVQSVPSVADKNIPEVSKGLTIGEYLSEVGEFSAHSWNIDARLGPLQIDVTFSPIVLKFVECLELGSTAAREVAIINSSDFPVQFLWCGNPESIRVDIEPSVGRIEAKSSHKVKVEVRPDHAGKFDVEVSCFLKGLESPLILRIIGNTEME